MNHKPIYLDYMSTTPVDERVAKAMNHCLTQDGIFANPSSNTHRYGWEAAEAIKGAAEQVASAIGGGAKDLIWTAGATESINMALKGVAHAYQRQGKHIVSLKTEHKAVLDVLVQLEREGFDVTLLDVEPNGLLDLAKFKASLRPDTILASVCWVNNEIGVIQDVAQMAALTRANGTLLHVDAAQAIGKIKVDVAQLDIDLLSLSAHKAYGPKGIGALYLRPKPRIQLEPLLHGGGQQRNLRSGTLATHQIVAMGEAYQIASDELDNDLAHIQSCQQHFWQQVTKALPQLSINGDMVHRVPHNLNILVPGLDGEALIYALKDIAISRGSACTAASVEPSHVLTALGLSRLDADSSLRISFGRMTTLEQVQQAAMHFIESVKFLYKVSG